MTASKVVFLKTPLSVKWYVTSKCNLRCKHCYLPEYKRHPDQEKILRLIDGFCDRNVRYMSILGGEPTIRPDLEVIIEKMTTRNVQVNMSSNGTLIDKNRAQSLKSSGLQRIQISLEGPNATINDEIRGPQTFKKACNAIENLKDHDFHVTIAYTLNNKNYIYLKEMYEFTKKIGAQRLRLEVYVPLGHGAAHRDSYSLNDRAIVQIKNDIAFIEQHAEKSGIELKSPFYNAGSRCKGCSTFGCGAATTTVIVNSDFTISPCDLNAWHDRSARFIDTIADFDEIWQNDPAFKKWRRQSNDDLFRDVHQHACHAAYLSYGKNIFERQV